jgi:hypothetical protein
MGSAKLTAAKVRVEITGEDGFTYELQLDGPGVLATLGIETHTVTQPSAEGMWMETLPTGGATITLEASGELGKSERRQG